MKKQECTKEDIEDYALYKSGLLSSKEFKKSSELLKSMIIKYGRILTEK
jgi:hypothetical protein